MTSHHLKRATKLPASFDDHTRDIVQTMLGEIEVGGEARVRGYARKLDGWRGDIVVSRVEIEAATAKIGQRQRDDINFAHAQVNAFAAAQLASLSEFQTELPRTYRSTAIPFAPS